MINRAARFCSVAGAALGAALALALTAAPAWSEEKPPTADEILTAKCSLCHSWHRIYMMNPDELRPVLERMRARNPDWITQADSDHIVDVIARVLKDPSAVEARKAWLESVDRGKDLFNSPALGTTGQSCASCHKAGTLRNIEDAYPQFSQKQKRFVDLNEAINYMIQERLKGKPLASNDPRYFDLLAYIKTLK